MEDPHASTLRRRPVRQFTLSRDSRVTSQECAALRLRSKIQSALTGYGRGSKTRSAVRTSARRRSTMSLSFKDIEVTLRRLPARLLARLWASPVRLSSPRIVILLICSPLGRIISARLCDFPGDRLISSARIRLYSALYLENWIRWVNNVLLFV